jgi:hypothetical protein
MSMAEVVQVMVQDHCGQCFGSRDQKLAFANVVYEMGQAMVHLVM